MKKLKRLYRRIFYLNLIERLYTSSFKVISNEEAVFKRGLIHLYNVYGDQINHLNCRSIWRDFEGLEYRVKGLYYS